MNEVQFKFTLNNTIYGVNVIDEPIGWDDALLKLQRDKEFFGIIEYYDDPLTFHEGDGLDGGYVYIKNVLETQGPDADITILVEISNDDGETYEQLFDGLVDLSTYLQIEDYKAQCNILRNDLWSKFQNRKSTSIDLGSTTDLDGGTRVIITPPTITLTSQSLRQTYLARQDQNTSIQYATVPNNEYGIIDFSEEELMEIQDKFNYPRIKSATRPDELFAVQYAGNYHVSCDIYASTAELLGNQVSSSLNVYIQVNDASAAAFSETNQGTNGIDGRTRFRYSGDLNLNAGDFIRIYFQNVSGGNLTWVWFANLFYDSFLRIDADTTYTNTDAQIFPLHEAFQSVTDRILGFDDSFYSEFLGHGATQRASYGSDGCGSPYAITKGLHIRGYNMSDKKFSISFDDLWMGAHPILAIGLQPREISGVEKIEIVELDSLYESGNSIYLDYVNYIETSIDTSNTFKKIEIGYEKWESEDYSGIDDPQTKKQYATPLKKIGEEKTLYSKFIAASLAIENTRRKTIEQGKDYKLDNDTFIIALDRSQLNGTPAAFAPDLDDDFSSITGLLNSSTRYNIKLTPLRNFLRWYNYFNGALNEFNYLSSYKFVSGEGNYNMSANWSVSPNCAGEGDYAEDDDIPMNLDAGYHTNFILEFDYPLTWEEYKTIKEGKNKRIMVSSTNTNHDACYIDSIEYQVTKGIAKFKLWKV